MNDEMRDKIRHTVHIIAACYLLVLFLSPFAVRGHFLEVPVLVLDTLVSVVFLVELFVKRKRSKIAWFVDIWSVIPFFLLLGATPIALMCNVGKLLRGLRGLAGIHFRRHGFDVSAGLKVAATFVTLVLYFATLIVLLEGAVNQNLSTVEGGLWWAVVTITTTGYGDVTPETPLGRIAAAVLMLTGIGVSSAIGAVFVSFLLRPTEEKILRKQGDVVREEGVIEGQESEVVRLLRT